MAAILSSSSDAVRVLQAASTKKIRTVVAKSTPTRRCMLVSPGKRTELSTKNSTYIPNNR
jgi:uroporphyrinogen-III synthase